MLRHLAVQIRQSPLRQETGHVHAVLEQELHELHAVVQQRVHHCVVQVSFLKTITSRYVTQSE